MNLLRDQRYEYGMNEYQSPPAAEESDPPPSDTAVDIITYRTHGSLSQEAADCAA